MRKLSLFIVLAFAIFQTPLTAQSAEEEVKQLIRDAYRDLSDLETPHDVREFLKKHLTPDFTVHDRIYYDGKLIHDEVQSVDMYLDDLTSGILTAQFAGRKTELKDVVFVQTAGDIFVIGYTLERTLEEDGKIISQGEEIRVARGKKMGDSWKISSSNSDIVINTVNRAVCFYRYFSDGGPEILIKVNYPAGPSYESDVLQLSFSDLGDKSYEITTSGNDSFLWRNGKLAWMQDKSVSFPAKDRKQIAEELIMYYWSDHCPEVKSIQ